MELKLHHKGSENDNIWPLCIFTSIRKLHHTIYQIEEYTFYKILNRHQLNACPNQLKPETNGSLLRRSFGLHLQNLQDNFQQGQWNPNRSWE